MRKPVGHEARAGAAATSPRALPPVLRSPRRAHSRPLTDGRQRPLGRGARARWVVGGAGRNPVRDALRLTAVALVPVLAGPDEVLAVPVYGLLVAFVLVTSLLPRWRGADVAETAIAAGVAVTTGGLASAFMPYLLVAIAVVGARTRPMVGAAAGLVVSAAQVWALFDLQALPEVTLPVLVPLLAFLPLVGASAGMARRVFAGDTAPGRAALQEAHQLLRGLTTIAREIPGGLESTTITAAALDELKSEPVVRAVAIYAGSGPLLRRLAADGFPTDLPTVLPSDGLSDLRLRLARRVLPVPSLPASLAPFCASLPAWLLVPLVDRGEVSCCVIVGAADARRLRARLQPLVALAEDTALALDNARLFDEAQTRAAEAARRRIAHDLHDSVAQALTHLRLELDLLARQAGDDDVSSELERLGRVTGRALQDVRATIDGLRGQIAGGGLAQAIQQHARDLGGTAGMEVIVDGVRDVPLHGDRALEVFRIAQEALSNALRHSGGTSVEITLEEADGEIYLVVEDDGRGLPEPLHQGVGLGTMRERARDLRGELVQRPRRGGGTVVQLRCPVPR